MIRAGVLRSAGQVNHKLAIETLLQYHLTTVVPVSLPPPTTPSVHVCLLSAYPSPTFNFSVPNKTISKNQIHIEEEPP